MTLAELAPPPSISRLDAALDLAHRGWAVFPLHTILMIATSACEVAK